MIFYMLFLYTSVLGLGLGKILTSGLSKFSSGGDIKLRCICCIMKLFLSTQIHSFWHPYKIHIHNLRSAGLQDYRVYLTMKLQSQKVMLWFTQHSPMNIEIINAYWHQVDAFNFATLLFVCDVPKIKSSKTSFWDNKFINITLSPTSLMLHQCSSATDCMSNRVPSCLTRQRQV